MITKAEWQEWRDNKVTQKLVELLKIGTTTAIEDLVTMRGEVGDFPRGASTAFDEVVEYIRTGDGIYSQEE